MRLELHAVNRYRYIENLIVVGEALLLATSPTTPIIKKNLMLGTFSGMRP